MSNVQSAGTEPCPFCHTRVPRGATYCTGCHARYGYENQHVQRSLVAWLSWSTISLAVFAAGVGIRGADGTFGAGEAMMAMGGLAAAFGVLGTVMAGFSLGIAAMRGKKWWR
jgi:hypothetical protein